MLTQQEIEELVVLISSGKNTYADIHRKFPNLSSKNLIYYIGDNYIEEKDFSYNGLNFHRANQNLMRLTSNRTILLFFIKCPDDFYDEEYIFKATDSFELSVAGENILYRLNKEHIADIQQRQAICWAKYATVLTAIGLILQILTSDFTASVLSKILNLLS